MSICLRRREFIAALGGAAVWPLAAGAQVRQRLPVIGYLSAGSAASDRFLAAFREALDQGGYVEGRNVEILFRYAEFQHDRLPSLVADLVRRGVAVIVATGGAPALAAKEATATIPIVFATGLDAVAIGFVPRLNRPGGNLTGASYLSDAYFAKGIELMHELVPEAGTFSYLMNPTNPTVNTIIKEMENSARNLRLRLTTLNASNPPEIDRAFSTLAQERTGGVMLVPDQFIVAQFGQIIALATRFRVPVMSSSREFVQAGGLMSYGGSYLQSLRIVGDYAARILKGDKPGDLPVQLSTRIEFAINLKTAKALGLTVPTSILVRADEIIE
jgi:putative ABC transport system substrate-binding protein